MGLASSGINDYTPVSVGNWGIYRKSVRGRGEKREGRKEGKRGKRGRDWWTGGNQTERKRKRQKKEMIEVYVDIVSNYSNNLFNVDYRGAGIDWQHE